MEICRGGWGDKRDKWLVQSGKVTDGTKDRMQGKNGVWKPQGHFFPIFTCPLAYEGSRLVCLWGRTVSYLNSLYHFWISEFIS